LNVSKYAPTDDVSLPQAGDRVELTLNGQNLVSRITVMAGIAVPEHLDDASGGAPDRQSVITRLAVLNAATAILAAGNLEVDPDGVVSLAAARVQGHPIANRGRSHQAGPPTPLEAPA
jgi:hypothetical protein